VQRLKVLFLPAAYPSEDSPINGVFVKERTKSGLAEEIAGKIKDS
jgi:hypothetical protein